MQKEKSSTLFPRAKQIMPGGVNSPVRAFNAVGGEPLFIKSAKGSKIIDGFVMGNLSHSSMENLAGMLQEK